MPDREKPFKAQPSETEKPSRKANERTAEKPADIEELPLKSDKGEADKQASDESPR